MRIYTHLLAVLITLFSAQTLRSQVSSNVTFRSQLDYTAELANIWGWFNPVDGKEYALVGLTTGLSIVDVSNPAVPNELFNIPFANSLWREIKTWGNYAYVTNETGGGLLIVDMSNLPASINTYSWTGGALGFSTGHTIFIDENGVAYVCGSNGSLGTLFLDVAANPINPPVLGSYTTRYVHDCYVRGDTMWAAEINNGIFSVVDVSNKSAPVVMATQSTSSSFTHNVWVTEDGRYLYSTDEVSGASVDSYDVSDLTDIQELDRFRPNTTTSSIPHNTYILNNFLVTSWYRDGMRITDATQPDNLIEVGYYDTSPLSGNGFNGAWGVYPYLPSGNALVSDIEGGLFVLTPNYTGAAFIEGVITDQVSGVPLINATISLTGTTMTDLSDLFGRYSTGQAGGGTYTAVVSRAGYVTQTIPGVSLTTASTTTLNVALVPASSYTLNGQVRDALSGAGISSANILLQSGATTYPVTADASGNFSLSGFPSGVYDVYAGKWGYTTSFQTSLSLNPGSGPLNINLNFGYTDDFVFNQGWTVSGSATSGVWQRGEPIGTSFSGLPSNPELDLPADLGSECYVTGNAGGAVGADDVDNGRTILRSPFFDLSGGGNPQIVYSRWFFNAGGSGSPNDSLIVKISNGSTTAVLETVTATTPGSGTWVSRSYRILDFVSLSASMQFTVETADAAATGHLVEGGLDGFSISGAVAPGCNPPANTVTTNITSSTARVNWDAVAGATAYQLQGRKAGTVNFRNINTSAITRNITGLNSGTNYEWKVRAQCAGGSLSNFTALVPFSTLIPRLDQGLPVLDVQPNPARETTRLMLDFPDNAPEAGTYWLTVSDLQGRQMMNRSIQCSAGPFQEALDISNYSAGTYWITLEGEGWQMQRELIVVR